MKSRLAFYLLLVILVQGFSTSLWQNSQNDKFKNLYSDNKAYKVGDILTIIIVETVSMTQEDNTSNKVGGLLSSTFSIIKNISNIDLTRFLPIKDTSTADAAVSNTENTANSQITAKIAAVVTEVDNYGNLWLEGKKEVKVGQDRRELVIQGFVRPSDVSASNSIDSYKIANAKLWYNGDVVFQQNPGEENWVGYILSGLSKVIF